MLPGKSRFNSFFSFLKVSLVGAEVVVVDVEEEEEGGGVGAGTIKDGVVEGEEPDIILGGRDGVNTAFNSDKGLLLME